MDGFTHQFEETIIKDKKRQTDLEAAGFTVLRFTDEEILNRRHIVRFLLEEWIEKKEASIK